MLLRLACLAWPHRENQQEELASQTDKLRDNYRRGFSTNPITEQSPMEFLCCGFDLLLLRCFLHNFMFLSFYRKQRTAVMLSTLLGAFSLPSLSKCQKICLSCVLPPAIASSSRNTDGKTPSSEILFFFLSLLLSLSLISRLPFYQTICVTLEN